MKKVVTITAVNHNVTREKRDGGTYDCTVLQYIDAGAPRETVIATAFLDKQPGLKKAIDTLKEGFPAEITVEKKGLYWNLTDVRTTTTPVGQSAVKGATQAATHARGSFADNARGMQVGNALNNAAILIAHGQASGTLEEVARKVLQVGEKLRAELEAGEFAVPEQETTTAQKEVVVDKDIPFGD